MAIKYSIKDIVEVNGEYDVTIGANRNNQGDMIFTIRLPDLTTNSIDVESISRLALLIFKSGVSLTNLQKVAYQFTVN